MRRALLVLLGLIFCGRAVAGGPTPGTLDRLAGDFTARLQASLAAWGTERARRADLLLSLKLGGQANARLKVAVQRLLLARLARCGLASVRISKAQGTIPLARWARRAGFELLLRVELLVDSGHAQLRGDLAEVSASLWPDLLAERRGSLSHLYARVRADAEVRSYLGAAGRVRLRFGLKRQRLGRGPALDLALADVDGDGRAELAVLRPRALELWRLHSGRWRRHKRIALEGRQALLRPRRAIGSLLVADLDRDGRVELHFRSSEAAQGNVLDLKATPGGGQSFGGYPLMLLEGARFAAEPAPGVDYFRAKDLQWPKSIAAKALPARFYRLAGVQLPGKGGAKRYAAAVDLAGTLHLLDGSLSHVITTLSGVGSTFALLDADDDGRLEVLVSAADESGKEERVRVFRLAGKTLRPLWRSALLSGQLTAFAHGDADGDGRTELFGATLDERGRAWLYQLD